MATATSGLDAMEDGPEHTLRSALRTFVADACPAAGDNERALDLLHAAAAAARSRGEQWWLAETLRLTAVALARSGRPTDAAGLLDDARSLAAEQRSTLLVARVAATHAAGTNPDVRRDG